MRIVNGRLFKDQSAGQVTCYTHNGESVVDYVITSSSTFNSICDFEICSFNEYSNHAPICFSLKTHIRQSDETMNERIYYKWNNDYKEAFRNDISRDLHLLNRSISDGISRNCDTDDIVAFFTQFLTDRADPYFKKRYIPRKESFFNHTSRLKKQKWYNEECKLKREAYISALHNFNSDRNSETRKIMLEAKKDYKYYCRSCKLKYSYEQGRKMNEMRKKQPREFWKMFKHKKQTPTESEFQLKNSINISSRFQIRTRLL